MIYTTFKEDTLSLLGFGAMRLPTLEDGAIDEKAVDEMVRYALENGVNYFDTAYPYHGGASERVIGRALSKSPRESFRLATKYPGHQISNRYDPAAIFEEQLEKCGVEYFDYYLLHNVYEKSAEVYMDEKWGILDYFKEQKRLGRIRHLGFSSHGRLPNLREFLDYCGDAMEFCQIQLNYLDWSLQDAKAKYELLTERGIPIWVMEPVRGGKLAKLPAEAETKYKALRPDESVAAWGFRFLQGLSGINMILSGMSDLDQMKDNVKTFSERSPLDEEEMALAFETASVLKNSVPCTACRYCVDGCPIGLDIPTLLGLYNELRFLASTNVGMRIEAFPENKRHTACVSCGRCARVCPQNIDIPTHMRDAAEMFAKIPRWENICREREAAMKAKS